MKTLGILIFLAGAALGGYALNMDTSVSVDYHGYNLGLPERVNNLGLMQDKQNYLIVSGIMVIAGLIMVVTAKSPEKEISKEYSSHFELAKKAEYKGEYKEAIHFYVESLFEIENKFKPVSKRKQQEKNEIITSLKTKIEELKIKQAASVALES